MLPTKGKQMNCANHIDDLENNPSRLNKEAIIRAIAEDGNDVFFEGARLALDPMITFGLKQIPEKIEDTGNGLPWDHFTLAITGFVSRNVTGNTARTMVQSLMNASTKEEWNKWYRRILIKDLRCGVSEKTINNAIEKSHPHYAIPIFSCQLAHDSANHETKVIGEKLIEVKLDGVRVITVAHPDGRVLQFSRNGKELVNFPHIVEQFKSISKDLQEATVFDGEIMSGSFQDLMTQIHRKSDVDAKDAILHLFDIMPLRSFENGLYNVKQKDRSKRLVDWKQSVEKETPNIFVVGQELVDLSTDEGKIRYKEINSLAIAGGYEGIMLKDPNAIYECKRSVAWLKLKPFIEVSLEVKYVEEGTGKNIGRFGAFVCKGADDGKEICANVGSGFTDVDRINIWHSRDTVIGHVVEVRADAITQNQDGTFSLRFPRFIRFRGFTPGEKI